MTRTIEKHELYVDGDKNKNMVRTEILTKRLGVLLGKHVAGVRVFAKRT